MAWMNYTRRFIRRDADRKVTMTRQAWMLMRKR